MSNRPGWVPEWGEKGHAIAKEGYEEQERKRRNSDHAKKLRRMSQSDEQRSINKHNEGFCYGCARRDYILSSLYYCCEKCMHQRGLEGLLAIVKHKMSEDLCDFCGRMSRAGELFQINCSLCNRCRDKMIAWHLRWKEEGGRDAHNPLLKKQKRKWGKDYKILSQSNARKLNI